MGPRGAKIVSDISYPGQWSVGVLHEKFKNSPEEFQDWCRFKWSFNIRPDMVVQLPVLQPLCIEAKLESPEGQYPSSSRERDIFDEVFGKGKGRVGQFELQRFMFKHHLKDPCQNIFIGKKPPSSDDDGSPLFLHWKDVFRGLDRDSSIPFVRRLIEENRYL